MKSKITETTQIYELKLNKNPGIQCTTNSQVEHNLRDDGDIKDRIQRHQLELLIQ